MIVNRERLDALAHDRGALDALIAVPDPGVAEERLRVYAGGYPARIQDALAETFPAVAHLVGASAFAALTRRFAAAIPLHSYNLNDAGAPLPEFLRDHRQTARLPFLPDLARLEWRVACAFNAHDQTPLDPAPLATCSLEDWEGAVLRFQPWVALVVSDWPIREIWDCRETPVEQIDIDVRNRPDRVLVRRAGLAVTCESLGAAEASALSALLAGQTLGSVAATLSSRGNDPASVSTWFARWMHLHMITGCVCTEG